MTDSSSSESALHAEKDAGKTGGDATVHRVAVRTELRQGSWGWTKGMDSRDPVQVDATGSATLHWSGYGATAGQEAGAGKGKEVE